MNKKKLNFHESLTKIFEPVTESFKNVSEDVNNHDGTSEENNRICGLADSRSLPGCCINDKLLEIKNKWAVLAPFCRHFQLYSLTAKILAGLN